MLDFNLLQFLEIQNIPESERSKLEQEHQQLISNYIYIKIAELFSEEELSDVYSADQLIHLAREKYPDLESKIAVYVHEYKAKFLQKIGGSHV